MAFIKEESEEIKIGEVSSVKQEDTEEQTKMGFIIVESEEMKIEAFIVKQEDTEEQTKMEFIKEENEEMKIDEAFVVKQEETEEQTKMAFIKEESEDMTIEEAFSVKHTVLPYQFEPESDPENADDQVDESELRLQQNVSQWCRCENCNRMPSGVENVCCMEIPKAGAIFGKRATNAVLSELVDRFKSQFSYVARRLWLYWSRLFPKDGSCLYTQCVQSCVLHPAQGLMKEVLRRMNQVSEPLKCMTHHPGFEPNCLNPYTLQNILNIYKADYGPLRRRTEEGRYRYLAHRSFASWCWGYVGRKIRVVLPSCVVLRIQQEFPDPDGQFVGFRPPLD